MGTEIGKTGKETGFVCVRETNISAYLVSQRRGSSSHCGFKAESANLSMEERRLGTAQKRAAVRKGSAGHGMENSMKEGYQSEKISLVWQVRLKEGGEDLNLSGTAP